MTDLKEGFPVHGVEDDSGEDQGEESAQHQSHPRGGGLQQGQQACNFKSHICIGYLIQIISTDGLLSQWCMFSMRIANAGKICLSILH